MDRGKKKGGKKSEASGSKRRGENTAAPPKNVKFEGNTKEEIEDNEALEFEDPFPDDVEPEEEVAFQDDDEDGMEVESGYKTVDAPILFNDEENEEPVRVETWYPGQETTDHLEMNNDAYVMYHTLSVEWPCLSFDIIPDPLGDERKQFPHTAYVVMGTQTDSGKYNQLLVSKFSSLHKTQHDDEESEEDDDEVEENAILEHRHLKHPGNVNRVRIMPQAPYITATWSENGTVFLWDIMAFVEALDVPPLGSIGPLEPIKSITLHQQEGYALAWSPVNPGRLLAGSCNAQISLTEMTNASFSTDPNLFHGHIESVEDLQWSPTEGTVFASCSVDKTIKIWDSRTRKPALSFVAADCDVNVISWNKNVAYLLASGAEDGVADIWDLRSLKPKVKCTSLQKFAFHKDQITSIEWDPNDDSVIALAGGDDQVTIWDLSVEPDPDALESTSLDVPHQLLFVHQGQTEIKEIHWHPQIPGVLISTASDGFNVFQPDISE
eukprot:TRINITY_DN6774_c0_g1_i1.p1 TRINITY_DN6774_c0_g1~~TRINITY_DN6774_c0_g1_i1.p1  ORF type:complete len:494 (-),score=123.71 TRINITY_DN6774_c0_g1_i1:218-1699(-)